MGMNLPSSEDLLKKSKEDDESRVMSTKERMDALMAMQSEEKLEKLAGEEEDGKQVKSCSHCEEIKPLKAFTKDKSKSCGVSNLCKECRKGHRQNGISCNGCSKLIASKADSHYVTGFDQMDISYILCTKCTNTVRMILGDRSTDWY
jgi:hypothetical protein